jgi:hypothetical protein
MKKYILAAVVAAMLAGVASAFFSPPRALRETPAASTSKQR